MSLNLLSMSYSSMLISCTPCFFSSSDHQIMHRYQASFQLHQALQHPSTPAAAAAAAATPAEI
jgi:hypothetical protein